MKIGIMQPYFFPYLGYFQLLNMVDKYVVFDNAPFANLSWGYRNRILINGAPGYFRVNPKKASQHKLFTEIEVINDKKFKDQRIKALALSYGKAPYYKDVMPILEDFLLKDYDSLAQINIASNILVCSYLGIQTEILKYSELDCRKDLIREHRIYEICRALGGDEYVNAIGGLELYDFEDFRRHGIKLSLLRQDPITYPQFGKEFVPNLSIIDTMMFNSVTDIQQMLTQYTLVTEKEG